MAKRTQRRELASNESAIPILVIEAVIVAQVSVLRPHATRLIAGLPAPSARTIEGKARRIRG